MLILKTRPPAMIVGQSKAHHIPEQPLWFFPVVLLLYFFPTWNILLWSSSLKGYKSTSDPKSRCFSHSCQSKKTSPCKWDAINSLIASCPTLSSIIWGVGGLTVREAWVEAWWCITRKNFLDRVWITGMGFSSYVINISAPSLVSFSIFYIPPAIIPLRNFLSIFNTFLLEPHLVNHRITAIKQSISATRHCKGRALWCHFLSSITPSFPLC